MRCCSADAAARVERGRTGQHARSRGPKDQEVAGSNPAERTLRSPGQGSDTGHRRRASRVAIPSTVPSRTRWAYGITESRLASCARRRPVGGPGQPRAGSSQRPAGVQVGDCERHAATRRLRQLAGIAGVRLPRMHPHMLRRIFVNTMLDAGVDLRDVQIAARRADPRTTIRYDRARKNFDRHPNYILAAYMDSGT